MTTNRKRLAIVTPQHRYPLTAEEQVSLRHMRHFLGEFDRFLICPETSTPDLSDFILLRVPDQDLAGIPAYSRLLMSKRFYQWFADYDYILIYQFDCLAFSHNILDWCDQGYDYIGAPWFQSFGDDSSGGFIGVGNGGLSLRKVKSHLEVLNSNQFSQLPVPTDWLNPSFVPSLRQRVRFHMKSAYKGVQHYAGVSRAIDAYVEEVCSRNSVHEDQFWSWAAPLFKPDFRIPTCEQALSFAFECAPRVCLEANQGRMPFGCHAWAKFDRAFWEPFLLEPGSQ